jgi:signal transduction histidine kinase
MTTTILKVSSHSGGRAALGRALSDAGVGVVEVEDWESATEALRKCAAALVVRDGDLLDSADATTLAKAVSALGSDRNTTVSSSVSPDVMRSLSHDLRTPLSAMAGWLHLMESGKLDEAGIRRAITKLRSNIDDQVKTIDRYLGTATK